MTKYAYDVIQHLAPWTEQSWVSAISSRAELHNRIIPGGRTKRLIHRYTWIRYKAINHLGIVETIGKLLELGAPLVRVLKHWEIEVVELRLLRGERMLEVSVLHFIYKILMIIK